MRRYIVGVLLTLLALVATPAGAQTPLTSNYIRMVGANFGTSPSLTAFGTDTNISIILVPKGSGSVQLGTGGTAVNLTDANGNTWIAQTPSANAVNNLAISDAATGNSPSITATGTDTNVGLNFYLRGEGVYRFRGGQTAASNSAHFEFLTSTAPTLSSCGTGSITVGSGDMVGDVTATGATSCTITFNQAWTSAPFCMITEVTTAGSGRVSASSTTAFTVASLTSGDRFLYHCFGRY